MIPTIVSTWPHGLPANRIAWPILSARGGAATALDAVEAAVRHVEADPDVRSVGRGGYPDRLGRVTLDAAIMDDAFGCGSVAALEGVVHAVSVARAVMERTEHALLAGDGALEFALSAGFERERLVTADTLALFEREQRDGQAGRPNFENHDTVVSLAIDPSGRIAGASSTSGLMNRLHGRVGDTPIIGSGLYVDGQVGAAGATGHGELAMRVAASALVVERMRCGAAPLDACRSVIDLIRDRLRPPDDQQLALLALSARGEVAAAALLPGFAYAQSDADGHRMVNVEV